MSRSIRERQDAAEVESLVWVLRDTASRFRARGKAYHALAERIERRAEVVENAGKPLTGGDAVNLIRQLIDKRYIPTERHP